MDSKKIRYYQDKIAELGDWYQPIVFIKGALETKSKYSQHSTLHGVNKWNFILRKNLPMDLRGKRVLDIGCASGLYSMFCAREGAQVIGLELDEAGYRQSVLTREIFSLLDGKDYSKNFEILHVDLMRFDWNSREKFDIIMALNVLYWVTVPYVKIAEKDRKNYERSNLVNLVKNIREHSDMFLVQADENKYWERKQKGASTEATNIKKVTELLHTCGYQKICVDKPISLASLWQTLLHKTAEVELRKPIFYARPVIKAES